MTPPLFARATLVAFALQSFAPALTHAQGSAPTVQPAPMQAPATAPTQAPATSAQAPATSDPAPAAATIGPDLVRLKDGSRWRGTIVEQVAESHVVLVTFSGEAKRFDAAQVSYAGPSQGEDTTSTASAPLTTPTPPVAANGAIRVSLKPPQGLSFYVARPGAKRGTLMCHGDCTALLMPGEYAFALGNDYRQPLVAPGTFSVKQADELTGTYQSARGARIAGGVVLGVGTSLGLGTLLAGRKAHEERYDICDGDCNSSDLERIDQDAGKGAMIFGAITMVASAIVGLVLLVRKDKATVHQRSMSQHAATAVQLQPTPTPAPAEPVGAGQPGR